MSTSMIFSKTILVLAIGAAGISHALADDGWAEGPRIAPAATDSTLETERGGTSVSATNNVDGVLTGNTAIGTTSGSNAVSGGAFAGMTGIPMVIQNTGNNVIIQNATTLNVQLN